jgi:hypothetical protein
MLPRRTIITSKAASDADPTEGAENQSEIIGGNLFFLVAT